MANSQVKIFTLNSIFQMMENGSISSPSFERGFVWTPELVKSLFDSINKGYPIGMILAVEGESEQFDRSPSEKSYFPDSDLEGFDTWKTLWILDGSQRLAALYSVLKGKKKTVELYYDLSEREFSIDKVAVEPTKTLPMASLFDATAFRHFQTYLAQQENTENLIDELHSIHRRFMNYAIPIQIIADVTDTEIIDIFKKLNMSGVSLTREDIEKSKDYKKHSKELDVNNLQPRTELSQVYQRQGKLAEAEAMLLESLQIGPRQLHPRIELAKIYRRQSRIDEAEKIAEEVLKNDPLNDHAISELLAIWKLQGKRENCSHRFIEFISQPGYRFTRYSQAPVFRFLQCCKAFDMKQDADNVFQRFRSKLDDQNLNFYTANFL